MHKAGYASKPWDLLAAFWTSDLRTNQLIQKLRKKRCNNGNYAKYEATYQTGKKVIQRSYY
jgi:hypothetical protein